MCGNGMITTFKPNGKPLVKLGSTGNGGLVGAYNKTDEGYAVIAMAEILKAAGLDLLFFAPGAPIVAFFPSDASGNLAVLSDGWLWAGFFFTLIVTNIVVWPLGFYMRRLPVLNKMF